MSEADAIAAAARPATRSSIATELRTLGIERGMTLMVHSSLSRLGFVAGGAHAVVLALLDAVGPDELRIPKLIDRVKTEEVTEVILALSATIDGQTTAHYIADQLPGVEVTSLAQGVPVGGELDYLDDGTITAALNARRKL